MRRNNLFEKNIGDKDARLMTRRRLASGICLVSFFEPKTIKEALDNEDWIQSMNEEIE